MSKPPRKRTLTEPRSPWERMIQESEGSDRSQAGEIEAGDEQSGGGSKGLDAETGDGGYGGDAVEAGHQESVTNPERPVDREIHGHPRTHEGESYPDDAKVVDDLQGPLTQQPIEEEDEGDRER